MTEFNPLLHNLQPVNFQRGTWTPEAWNPAGPDNQPNSRLTVALPGEFAVATCIKVVSPNAVVAQLGPCMMTGKGHDYRAKDIIPVRREDDGLGGERWVVVSERELQMNDMIQRFEMIERALAYPAPEEKAKALPSPEKPRGASLESESSEATDLSSEGSDRVTASSERSGDAF
jgi:hypothetical protein